MRVRSSKVSIAFAILVVGIVIVPVAIGSGIPPDHRARVRTRLSAPPEAVYGTIADVGRWPEWIPGYGPIRPLPPRRGHPTFESRADDRTFLVYEVVESDAPSHLRMSFDSTNGRLRATWAFAIRGDASGTVVDIVEDARTNSPVLRFVLRYVVGYEIGIRGFARALERRFGSNEAPATLAPVNEPGTERRPRIGR